MSVRAARPSAFTTRVLAAVRSIPPGFLATYGDVAARAGRPGAARAVGTIMRRCRDPLVPCHRVVAAGGYLGGYGGHLDLKRRLLELEGCQAIGGRLRDFAERHWQPRRPARRRARGGSPRDRS
jgi:methylated-DNA-[protein]-cysteine S-methyltransferase